MLASQQEAKMHDSRREIDYRGYKIRMERRDLCWAVAVSPTRADLPIISRSQIKTITQSERAALTQAKRRIDRVLREVMTV
jgi:phosphoserine phosphatase